MKYKEVEYPDTRCAALYKKEADDGNPKYQYKYGLCCFEGVGSSQDYWAARRYFYAAAKQGNMDAEYYVAYCYEFGYGIIKDLTAAIAIYNKLAVNGHPESQFRLGYLSEMHDCPGHPSDKAHLWYARAMENNHPAAAYRLGLCYESGLGVDKSYTCALKCHKKAAELGFKDAIERLNWKDLKNNSQEEAIIKLHLAAEQNVREAKQLFIEYGLRSSDEFEVESSIKYLLEVVSENNATARDYYNMGSCYENATVVKQSYPEAIKWYQKAADEGDKDAKRKLSWNKIGCDVSDSERCSILRLAAEQKIPEAEYLLAKYYKDDVGTFSAESDAFFWFSKASEQGHAASMYALGICFEKGQGTDISFSDAIHWYQKAKAAGYSPAAERLDWKKNVDLSDTEIFEKYLMLSVLEDPNVLICLANCYELGLGVTKSEEDAFKCYQKAAMLSCSDAEYHVGRCYERGIGAKQSYDAAVEHYKIASDNGSALASARMDWKQTKGMDEKEKFESYNIGAAMGDPEAKYLLGCCCESGIGTKKSTKSSIKYYEAAAEQGFVDAKIKLGKCYELGIGVNVNPEKAYKIFFELAESNNSKAQFMVGQYYEFGKWVDQSYSEALIWYQKSSNNKFKDASRRLDYRDVKGLSDEEIVKKYLLLSETDPEIQYLLGKQFEFGLGVEKSYSEAAKYYQKAANSGNAEAIKRLDLNKKDGLSAKEQFDKYNLIAELGDCNAYNLVAYCYELGKGVEQSYSDAAKWYKRSADLGNPEAIKRLDWTNLDGLSDKEIFVKYSIVAQDNPAEIQYLLGNYYELGKGVEKSLTNAVKCYRISANEGNTNSQIKLAELYLSGSGVSQSYPEAVRYYKMAADKGNTIATNMLDWQKIENLSDQEIFVKYILAAIQKTPEAQLLVADCYKTGKGVDISDDEATAWYGRAAENGLPEAQYKYAVCKENGNGTPVSVSDAFFWYTKAAEHNHTGAQYKLGSYYEKGLATEQSFSDAAVWYQKAAESGNTKAETHLDWKNTQGVSDEEKYLRYGIAASQNFDQAQLLLGECYEFGFGTSQSFILAAKSYELSALQKNIDAQYRLGICYKVGKGVNQSYDVAAKWFRLAADRGHPQAQCELGHLFEIGMGLPIFFAEAVKWYRLSADQKNGDAQCYLALMYASGNRGVRQSDEEALRLIGLSIDNGSVIGNYYMGNLCEARFAGLEKTMAIDYYITAADHGHIDALRKLRSLYGTESDSNRGKIMALFKNINRGNNEDAKRIIDS